MELKDVSLNHIMKLSTKILWFVCLFLMLSKNGIAQQIDYLEVYPVIPFDIKKASELGYFKTSCWLNSNMKTQGDESGTFWSKSISSYNALNYEYFEGEMQMVYEYDENNRRIRSEEYFYKDSFLTAIERLVFDSVGHRKVQNAFIYLYYDDGSLFHRVTEFGPPNHKLRYVDQFKFDSLGKVLNQRMSVSGDGPHIDSITGGLLHGDKRLIVREVLDSIERLVVFKNLYNIKEEYRSIKNSAGQIYKREKLNGDGSIMYQVMLTYNTLGYCTSKLYLDDKGNPFKQEYYGYNDEGLLETHITEMGEKQTYIEYSYYVN